MQGPLPRAQSARILSSSAGSGFTKPLENRAAFLGPGREVNSLYKCQIPDLLSGYREDNHIANIFTLKTKLFFFCLFVLNQKSLNLLFSQTRVRLDWHFKSQSNSPLEFSLSCTWVCEGGVGVVQAGLGCSKLQQICLSAFPGDHQHGRGHSSTKSKCSRCWCLYHIKSLRLPLHMTYPARLECCVHGAEETLSG